MSIEFLVTSFLLCLMPGIGVLYTLATALGGGVRAGLLAALGCTLVTTVHLAVALAGLAAVLHASAVLFQTIKWAGVAYLLWMAWGTLRGGGAIELRPEGPAPALRIVWRGVLLNLLNPKLPIVFMAFLPQFVPAGAPDASARLLELGLGFTATTAVVFAGYAAGAGAMRRLVLDNPRAMSWMRRAFAASFAGLGARLAMETA